jgi:hypothetical protein
VADSLGMLDDALEGVEYRESLKPLLEQLPPREKKILMLRFFGNMTQSQIAAELGISQMHVSRLLARTLAQLRPGCSSRSSRQSRRENAAAPRASPARTARRRRARAPARRPTTPGPGRGRRPTGRANSWATTAGDRPSRRSGQPPGHQEQEQPGDQRHRGLQQGRRAVEGLAQQAGRAVHHGDHREGRALDADETGGDADGARAWAHGCQG